MLRADLWIQRAEALPRLCRQRSRALLGCLLVSSPHISSLIPSEVQSLKIIPAVSWQAPSCSSLPSLLSSLSLCSSSLSKSPGFALSSVFTLTRRVDACQGHRQRTTLQVPDSCIEIFCLEVDLETLSPSCGTVASNSLACLVWYTFRGIAFLYINKVNKFEYKLKYKNKYEAINK